MLRTPVCELLGIDYPIVQAAIGPWSAAELSAAVSNAGGLGSLGTATLSAERFAAQLRRMRELTAKPFAINHTARPFNEELFTLTLAARPKVISYAIGDPGDLVQRVHEAGCLFMQQVHTVRQAVAAAERGVDIIIAQGGEAGGFGGFVGALALVPQVVDAVAPITVLAAGGIADGRGLAAALALGAQGVNIGTRFLASAEAAIGDDWKLAILAAESEDTVKVEFADDVFPPAAPRGYSTLPRVIRTPFVEKWNARPSEAHRHSERLRGELTVALREGRAHELVPFTGQTAGMIHDILSAAEIVQNLVHDAETTLRRLEDSIR